MESQDQKKSAEQPKEANAKKAAPKKLPSKQIVFNQGGATFGGKAKTTVNKGKKGGVNLMRKLSGM